MSRTLDPLVLTGGSKVSWSPLVSADGARVLFLSAATDLVTNTVSGTNLFLWDAASGNEMLVSVSPTGGGLNRVSQPALSANGRFATFLHQTNLYLCDLTQSSLSLMVSNASAASLSADGRFIAFESTDALASNDTNSLADVYAFDRTSSTDHSIFRAFTVSNPNVADGVMVLWNAVPGRTYRVQYKNGMEDPDWTDLQGDVVATTATGAKLDSTTQTAAARFYRVLAAP